ncbi:caspase-7 isoform X2 [Folsomia candida]|uniref:Caspase-2 n=1 Tax=Folsomia candida TaxID=158441 RepID=A0A226DEB5_FOLCA|nr:caspase-7 isoform X2 [Folsomia candida]OXA43318.1 Caspase-2 [Folsomia candida]
MNPTPYKIAKILHDDYIVLKKWKQIGYELEVEEEIMTNVEEWKYTGKMKMVDILTVMFVEAMNVNENYVESIRKALNETKCMLALGKLDKNLKTEEKKAPPPTNSVTPTQLPDEVDGDDDDVIDLTDEYNPLQIQVKLGAAYGSVEEGSCMLTSQPRGYVLMVNNIKFNDPARFRYRIGALYDSSYVEKLFPELKFKLDIHENVASKEALDKIIDHFRQKCIDENAKTCIVIICSHGGKDVIYSCNGDPSNIYEDIVYKFKNALDPEKDKNLGLKDVPKIFILNACRGRSYWEDDSVRGEEKRPVMISYQFPSCVQEGLDVRYKRLKCQR